VRGATFVVVVAGATVVAVPVVVAVVWEAAVVVSEVPVAHPATRRSATHKDARDIHHLRCSCARRMWRLGSVLTVWR
jgi:hypothetical protein